MQLTEKNTKDMREVRGLCNVLSSNLGNAIPLAPENCVANASAVVTATTTAHKLREALDVMLWGIPLDAILPEVADTTDLCSVRGHDLYTVIKYLRPLATGQMGDAGGNALPQHVQFVIGKISDRFAAALTAAPVEKWVDVAAVDRVAADIKAALDRGWNDDEATPESVEANILNILDAASGEGYYSRNAKREAVEMPFRWNYDRYVDGVKMAEGISVHAFGRDSANEAANLLMLKGEAAALSFRDNKPCASRCTVCWPHTPDHMPDRALLHQGPTPPDVPHVRDGFARAMETGRKILMGNAHKSMAATPGYDLLDPDAKAAWDARPRAAYEGSDHGDSAHAAEIPIAPVHIGMDHGAPEGDSSSVRPVTTASDLLADIMKTVQPVGGRYVITRGDGLDFQAAMRNADNYFMFKAREAARKAKSNDKH